MGTSLHEVHNTVAFHAPCAGIPFSSVVQDAKDKGYTEPDPREDLSGTEGASCLGAHHLRVGNWIPYAPPIFLQIRHIGRYAQHIVLQMLTVFSNPVYTDLDQFP